MHFSTILAMDLPKIQPDPKWENEVDREISLITNLEGETTASSVIRSIELSRLNCIRSAFGRAVYEKVMTLMDKFDFNTSDPAYLEFDDQTEELVAEYSESVNCVVFPDGKIVEESSYLLWDKFVIHNGKIYQKSAGQLGTMKRTKKAKKMKTLLNYPRSKLYKTLDEYARMSSDAVLDEQTGRYGNWYNPRGVFDWLSVGGRWPDMFLVREDCTEYSVGEISMEQMNIPAPEGYRWVACARKKDIQWDTMREWEISQTKIRFTELEKMFAENITEDPLLRIVEDGIKVFDRYVYRKDQTFEDFLNQRKHLASQYPVCIYGLFSEDSYMNEEDTPDWDKTVIEVLDDLDENAVLVGIDYHS